MCQQRKVKCNRKFPCSHCIRLGVSCVPATLNPRRRRRFAERELLDRVRRYETLLRQMNVRFESLFETVEAGGDDGRSQHVHVEEEASHNAATSLAALRQSGHNNNNCNEMVMDTDADTLQPPSSVQSSSSTNLNYEAKNFWEAIRNSLPGRNKLAAGIDESGRNCTNASDSDTEHAVSAPSPSSTSNTFSDRPHTVTTAREIWARQFSNTGSFFFRGPQQYAPQAPVTALHPAPAQIFRLWQIYLDNVDPLLKVTHTPSLQSRIIDAVARPNFEDIDSTLEVLMFGVYCVAVYSMTPSECQAAFGSSKQTLLTSYQSACEQALLNSGFLRTSDRDCLTALFFYLISLGNCVSHHTLYSLLGAAMRVAQAMQIDIEAGPHSSAKMKPLEAELRRRLWWALVLFDARISELSNHSPTMLNPTWSCCVPLNANDLDFRPELRESPRDAFGRGVGGSGASSSEALFVVVRSELGNAMRHMEYYLALSNPALKPLARDREFIATAAGKYKQPHEDRSRCREYEEINATEDMIHDKYLQYCDPANGLHFMTLWMARGFIARCRLTKYLSKFSHYAVSQPLRSSSSGNTPHCPSNFSSESIFSLRDVALNDALTVIEADTKIMTSPLTRGYRWLVHMYFPLLAYIYLTQELAQRISVECAKNVWEVMNSNYEAHFTVSDSENLYLFKMFTSTILHAWDLYKARMRAEGEPEAVEVPEIVRRIHSQLESASEEESLQTGAIAQTLGNTIDGTAVSTGDVIDSFPATLPVNVAQPSLFSGMQPAPPLFPSPNIGAMNLDMSGLGNWPPMAMPLPWVLGSRSLWG
ncbi:hypothetical protein SEPCBS119000_006670 [Sporothrix epigloea]|uniref:Zn(2)-C6 fungal-type domain-containing protein n=1 Tax=Sporothrix epigloea TaxID=1892477 RepID=A0ABP0E4Q4_9PEZI